jgi:hypothetical protein
MKKITIALALALATTICLAGPPATDEWISTLEGGWHGDDNTTPMGRMDFVLLFERESDGSLHSRTAVNSETWIDLRFRKDAEGRWLLDESAGMEGLGEQRYTLEPVEAPGDLRRWVWPQDPALLSVEMALVGDRMLMEVKLRGENHARYDLKRLPADALPELKRQLAAAEQLSPEERPIDQLVRDDDVPPALSAARAAVAADPTNARTHLQLGIVIGELLQSDPVNLGPRYASEMLRALRTAVDLDPSIPEAYYWLAGYYLNAPPIAGGSVDEAEQVARRLAELDPDGGAELLALVEQARNEQSINP